MYKCTNNKDILKKCLFKFTKSSTIAQMLDQFEGFYVDKPEETVKH